MLSVQKAIDMTSWKWWSRPHSLVSDWLRAAQLLSVMSWDPGWPPHFRYLSGYLRAETMGFRRRIWPWHLGHIALLLQEKRKKNSHRAQRFAGKAPNSIRGEWGHREWFHMLCKCLEIWYLILAGSSAVLSQDIKTILCPDKWQPSAGWGSCVLPASSSLLCTGSVLLCHPPRTDLKYVVC